MYIYIYFEISVSCFVAYRTDVDVFQMINIFTQEMLATYIYI